MSIERIWSGIGSGCFEGRGKRRGLWGGFCVMTLVIILEWGTFPVGSFGLNVRFGLAEQGANFVKTGLDGGIQSRSGELLP